MTSLMTWKARRYGGTVPAGLREKSADDRPPRVTKGVGLVRSHLNDETATTLQRDAHHDAAPFLGDLQRTIARPRLHRRHLVSPQTYIRVGGLPHSHFINVPCSASRDAVPRYRPAESPPLDRPETAAVRALPRVPQPGPPCRSNIFPD